MLLEHNFLTATASKKQLSKSRAGQHHQVFFFPFFFLLMLFYFSSLFTLIFLIYEPLTLIILCKSFWFSCYLSVFCFVFGFFSPMCLTFQLQFTFILPCFYRAQCHKLPTFVFVNWCDFAFKSPLKKLGSQDLQDKSLQAFPSS